MMDAADGRERQLDFGQPVRSQDRQMANVVAAVGADDAAIRQELVGRLTKSPGRPADLSIYRNPLTALRDT